MDQDRYRLTDGESLVASERFYGDSFVKPFDQRYFMADPFYSWVEKPLHGPWRCILIRGRGVASVRASGSDELLSVRGVNTQHLMLHARKAHWQTPVGRGQFEAARYIGPSGPDSSTRVASPRSAFA
jgi:hypothetical protein